MDQKRELTKYLLLQSFKELMLKYPFKKITIQMIADGAGVIRPTFYNYFKDKYELLEYCVEDEIMSSAYELLDIDMELEAIKMIFVRLERDKVFIKKAFEIMGQNSFRGILSKAIGTMFYKMIKKHGLNISSDVSFLTEENIVAYYSLGLVSAIELWLLEHDKVCASEMFETYIYLMSNSVLDLMDYGINI